jgi:hypothetical protein
MKIPGCFALTELGFHQNYLTYSRKVTDRMFEESKQLRNMIPKLKNSSLIPPMKLLRNIGLEMVG